MDETASASPLPTLAVGGVWNWDNILAGAASGALAAAMAKAIASRRWFGAKTRVIESLDMVDAIGVSPSVRLLLARIHFSRGPDEIYQVPLAFADDASRARLLGENTPAWIRVVAADGRRLGVLYDPLGELDFCRRLLALFESTGSLAGSAGELIARRTSSFDRLRGEPSANLEPKPVRAEQSNSSVIFGERLILKIFRRVEMGLNPDLEISDQLTRQHFAHTPPLAGWMEYRPARQEHWTLAMLQAFVPNQGDAWRFTLEWLSKSLAKATSASAVPSLPGEGICRAAQHAIPPAAKAAFGEFLSSAELLGKRTAEMHLALSADADNPAFVPETFSEADRREYSHRCTAAARSTFELLTDSLSRLSGHVAERAARVLAREPAALDWFARLADEPAGVAKIRCHGDYHLGQVLTTGNDFMIIDFEGEPARSISERRLKQLALRDVAGMIRSFHYASCTAAASRDQAAEAWIAEWTRSWYAWSSVAYLAAYRRTAGHAVFLPHSIDQFERLLDSCLLEKALYELRYELNNRPDWVYLPLAALEELLLNCAAPPRNDEGSA
jgi:1,4-alpha-glucan branching enzyme